MDALENAARQSQTIYKNSTLYTTLSPCTMCLGAILLYGIKKVIIGENITFQGEEDLLKSKGVGVEVLQSQECKNLMDQFIKNKPTLWYEDIGE